jgi:four helix bundle protein
MGAKIRDYRDLTVWQRAMELVVECYAAARQFPKSELYALSNQLQRAAVSVPSNIAEGNGRASLGDYLRHLSIANGSLMEVETQVRVARRLAYLTEAQEGRLLGLSSEVGRMLATLIARLRSRRAAAPRTGPRFLVPGHSG